MEAEFYFNNIYIGIVKGLDVRIASREFVNIGPKAVIQFFANKNVVDEWFITQTLKEDDFFNSILLCTDKGQYEANTITPIIPIPIIGKELWKFKIRIGEALGYIKHKPL